MVDSCPSNKMKPNIHCSVFREYEASFLIGAEAAWTTKTGKVGAISALDIPFLHRYTDGFIEGAKHVKSDVRFRRRCGSAAPAPSPIPRAGRSAAPRWSPTARTASSPPAPAPTAASSRRLQDASGVLRLRRRRQPMPAGAGRRHGQCGEEDGRRSRTRGQGHHGRFATADRCARPQRRRHGADRRSIPTSKTRNAPSPIIPKSSPR